MENNLPLWQHKHMSEEFNIRQDILGNKDEQSRNTTKEKYYEKGLLKFKINSEEMKW